MFAKDLEWDDFNDDIVVILSSQIKKVASCTSCLRVVNSSSTIETIRARLFTQVRLIVINGSESDSSKPIINVALFPPELGFFSHKQNEY